MKEERFFYDAALSGELPSDEAGHALRVLRLGVGDEIRLMDGKGTFCRAVITAATGHRCLYRIEEEEPQSPAWQGHLHLAMAPTKLMDRVEWFVEKATEIGFDELTFLDCQFSERRVVKEERIEKIIISAVKQSRKAWKPVLNCSTKSSDFKNCSTKSSDFKNGMTPFERFVTEEREGDKFICHCHEELRVKSEESKLLSAPDSNSDSSLLTLNSSLPDSSLFTLHSSLPDSSLFTLHSSLLFDLLRPGVPTTVLIGPEGDFSIDEVKLAMQHGYRGVSLGRSRLRTETAALVAVHMMQLKNAIVQFAEPNFQPALLA